MVASAVYPDPRTLYDRDDSIVQSPIKLWAPHWGGCLSGIGFHAFINYCRNRPFRSNIYMYPIHAAIWTVGFVVANKFIVYHYAKRDTIHKHYVELHPEDFPPPPKIKVGELFENWYPNR